MSIDKVLVTGSSGNIGTRLCERLMAETRVEVVGVDREPNPWNADVNNITQVADLRDEETFERLARDLDLVIHLAANARVHELVEEPDKARDNFLTIFNTLEFCRRSGIPRFMFASSREVYGNSEVVTHAENTVRLELCESPYSASKLGGEALVRSYQQCYGMDFIIFRFSNVYGMYDTSDRLVPVFIRRTRAGKDLTVFGEDKLLDFTYIDDAVDGVMLSMERFQGAKNEVYNIAYGEGATLVEVAERIQQRLEVNQPIRIENTRTGEVVKYIADTSKARDRLNFAPKVPLSEGVKKAVAWYQEHIPV